jgi:hypothetical protein
MDERARRFGSTLSQDLLIYDAPMADGLRFEVTKAKQPYARMFIELIGGLVSGSPSSADQSSFTPSKYPEVAIYNSRGDRRVLEVLNSDEEAQSFLMKAGAAYRNLPTDRWCEEYGVPSTFV